MSQHQISLYLKPLLGLSIPAPALFKFVLRLCLWPAAGLLWLPSAQL
jgi:hypothetical protein